MWTMTVSRFAMIYLVALLCFGWGYFTDRYGIFPGNLIRSVEDFSRGDVTETTTLAEKIKNDLGISPERFIRRYTPSDGGTFRKIALAGAKDRRSAPRLWIAPDSIDRYRVIVGAFDLEDAFWGAVLLDPSGHITHTWRMNGEIPKLNSLADELKSLYGVTFLPDGSAIFNMQEISGGLIKIDACSRVEWTKKGQFHHVVAPNDDFSAIWTFGGQQGDLHPKLLLIDTVTGATIKTIDMAEVEKANPETFIFDLQREQNVQHATHPNDIEPLPGKFAGAFPAFNAGDLLVSYHTTNLIFVLDPETLKIKWWFVGAGDGQHDPDWRSDGVISIFNNNYRAARRGAARVSTIVSVDPKTNVVRTVVDGRDYDFYSNFNGTHQYTDFGSVMVASFAQGRVFEVDLATGRKVFDFINTYEWANGRTLHISDAMAIDETQVKQWALERCSMNSASMRERQ